MPKVDGYGIERLPTSDRAELLAIVRRIRAAFGDGASHVRDLVLELERALETEPGDEAAEVG